MCDITALGGEDDPALPPQTKANFFYSVATKSFAAEVERATYRDLWLDRSVRG